MREGRPGTLQQAGRIKEITKSMELCQRETKNKGHLKNIIRHRQNGTDRVALGCKQGQIRDTTKNMAVC